MSDIKDKTPSKKNDIIVNEKSVRTLAHLLEETNLTEIEYQVGDHRIRVTRGGMMQAPMFPMQAPMAAPVAPSAPAAAPTAAAAPAPVAAPQGEPVTSPMVGTAYLASEPGAPNFAKVGDSVKKGDTLLIIEAMKVMNPIRAPRDGKVAEILIANGKPVEFGEVLLTLE